MSADARFDLTANLVNILWCYIHDASYVNDKVTISCDHLAH